MGYGDKSVTHYADRPVLLRNIIKISTFDQQTWVIVSNFNCFGKTKDDQNLCSGRGICVANDKCSCESGFSGNNCELTTCFGKVSSDSTVCSGNGNCTDVNLCECKSPFDGKECESSNNGILHTLWGFGYNHLYQLGDGTTQNRNDPVDVTNNIIGIQKIFSGYDGYNYVMSNHSRLYAAGRNLNGQLLDDSVSFQTRFSNIRPQLADIVTLSAGIDHMLFINTSGAAFGVGLNSRGQLGDGTTLDRISPVPLDLSQNNNFTKVATLFRHSLAVSNGQVYAFGEGSNGRLGLGSNTDYYTPQPIPGYTNIIDIVVGELHSVMLDNQAKVHTFGRNNVIFNIFSNLWKVWSTWNWK